MLSQRRSSSRRSKSKSSAARSRNSGPVIILLDRSAGERYNSPNRFSVRLNLSSSTQVDEEELPQVGEVENDVFEALSPIPSRSTNPEEENEADEEDVEEENEAEEKKVEAEKEKPVCGKCKEVEIKCNCPQKDLNNIARRDSGFVEEENVNEDFDDDTIEVPSSSVNNGDNGTINLDETSNTIRIDDTEGTINLDSTTSCYTINTTVSISTTLDVTVSSSTDTSMSEALARLEMRRNISYTENNMSGGADSSTNAYEMVKRSSKEAYLEELNTLLNQIENLVWRMTLIDDEEVNAWRQHITNLEAEAQSRLTRAFRMIVVDEDVQTEVPVAIGNISGAEEGQFEDAEED